MDPLRVAVVGAGWIARDHLATLARAEGVSVVAVCDVDETRAVEAAPGGANIYRDWQELLQCEELEALWICTPPLAHREPAVAALERGIAVYLEKPVARTLEDGGAIVAAAERTGTVCAIGYQWHGLELLDVVRGELEGQTVGLLLGRSVGPTQARPWFLNRAQGGGQLLERASHHIDLQRAVAGEVTAVQAAGSGVPLAQGAEEEHGDIEDAATLVLRLAGGGIGTIHVAWTRRGLPSFFGLDIVATEATLQLDLDPSFRLCGRSRGRVLELDAREHPFERTIRRFLAAARDRDADAVFCTPRDALGTLAVALACEEALESGETVAVPAELVAR